MCNKSSDNVSERTREAYFHYLCSIVGEFKGKCYSILLRRLHDKQFYWTVPTDDSSAFDGICLRNDWWSICGEGYNYNALNGPCSVLEMMIGLAIRCEKDVMQSKKKGDRTRVWFWQMIYNLNLEDCYDREFNSDKFESVIQKMLDRTYDEYGRGSLWPVDISLIRAKDMRTVDIWYQMSYWLQENYANELRSNSAGEVTVDGDKMVSLMECAV